MKTKNFALMFASVFAFVLLLGVSSAVVEITNTTSYVSSTDPSTQITFDLKVEAKSFTGQFDNARLVLPNIFGSNTEWTGDLDNFTLLPKTDTTTKTIRLTVPSNQQAKTYSGVIGFEGDYNLSGSIGVNSFPFSITINEKPSLEVSDATFGTNSNTTTFIVKNTGNTALSNIVLTSAGSFETSFSSSGFSLVSGATKTITATITQDLGDISFGSNSVTVTATSGTISDTGTLSVAKEYCEYNNLGNNLDITVDFNVKEGFGEDDEYWYPFDVVEVEIEVSNDGDEKIKDIDLEWGLYNMQTGKWMNDDDESFNLKDDEEETITFTMTLDEKVKDFDSGDWVFFVRATGEDEDFDDARTCVDYSKEIDLRTGEEFAVLGEVNLPEFVSCGQDFQISGEVWNIDSSELEDASLVFYNKDLGINYQRISLNDIGELDSEDFVVTLNIPQNAKEGIHYLKVWIYDEDNDVLENDEDDKAEFVIPLSIEGSCASSQSKASIAATLEEGGEAGESLVVKATITNTDSTSQTFTISADNYGSWATLESTNPNSIVLNSGESKEVVFTFKVNKDAEGDKNFNIQALSTKGGLVSQPVAVTIEGSRGFGITGSVISGDNWYLWGIGLLNLILVLIIIIVAIRVARH